MEARTTSSPGQAPGSSPPPCLQVETKAVYTPQPTPCQLLCFPLETTAQSSSQNHSCQLSVVPVTLPLFAKPSKCSLGLEEGHSRGGPAWLAEAILLSRPSCCHPQTLPSGAHDTCPALAQAKAVFFTCTSWPPTTLNSRSRFPQCPPLPHTHSGSYGHGSCSLRQFSVA